MTHEHAGHHQHNHHPQQKQPFDKVWRVWKIVVWTAVVLMLFAMGIYVATNDESVAPGVAPAQQVPAAQ